MIISVSIVLFLTGLFLVFGSGVGPGSGRLFLVGALIVALGVLNITDSVPYLRHVIAGLLCLATKLFIFNFGRWAIKSQRSRFDVTDNARGALLLVLVFGAAAGMQIAAIV